VIFDNLYSYPSRRTLNSALSCSRTSVVHLAHPVALIGCVGSTPREMAWRLHRKTKSFTSEISMYKLTSLLAALTTIIFQGCTSSHDAPSNNSAQQHRAGTSPDAQSGTSSDHYPTKLENCLTAVGADRTQCVAKEK
jgi:hypothetical protein